MKTFVKLFTFLLLFSISADAQKPVEKIPQFRFFQLDRNAFTENAVKAGKKSLFVFFDADCEHCQRAAKYLDSHYAELRSVNIYLVTLDDILKVKAFMATYCPDLLHKSNVLLLLDRNNEFITRFSPRKYPSMFLFSVKKKLLAYEDEEDNIGQLFQLVHTS